MANAIYNTFKEKISTEIDWNDNATTTIKAMLVLDTYTPDIDLDLFIDDVTGETSGAGYTAGGKEIITRVITVDNINDIANYDGDNLTWATSTITARGAVIYKDTGVAGTSPLICYIDFGINKTSSAGDFVIQWHVDGIFKLA